MPVGDWQHLCKVASTRCSVANYFMKFSLAWLGFNVIVLVYVDECLYEVLLISLYSYIVEIVSYIRNFNSQQNLHCLESIRAVIQIKDVESA